MQQTLLGNQLYESLFSFNMHTNILKLKFKGSLNIWALKHKSILCSVDLHSLDVILERQEGKGFVKHQLKLQHKRDIKLEPFYQSWTPSPSDTDKFTAKFNKI